MLEILLLVWMCRKMAALVKAKGRRPGGYCTLLVLFWFGGEVLVGAMALGLMHETQVAYLFALVGAVTGAVLAFVIARSRPSLRDQPTGGFPVIPVTATVPPPPPHAP